MREPHPAVNPAFLTGSTRDWPLAELAALGYRGLEVTPSCIESAPVWQPEAKEAGLRPICVNALPELRPYMTGSLSDDVAWRRRATVDRLLHALNWMADEEVSFLLVAPSRRGEIFQTEQRARQLLIESLRELAAPGKATVLLEAAPFRLFNNSEAICSIVDDVALPNVGAALDVGHAMLCGERPVEYARTLGPRLRYIQIRDVDVRPGLARLDQHLALGKGSLRREDVPDVDGRLPWTVSIAAPEDPLSAAKSALQWVRR